MATGIYLLSADDRDEALKFASLIPASAVLVRQLAVSEDCSVARMTNLDGVFRREWGAAVAAIARWSGDLTVAEDAVQEACAEALRTWPREGVPDHPGGWLVTVGAQSCAGTVFARESVRPGKEFGGRARRHSGTHRSHRAAPGSRRRAADDVHLCTPGAGPAIATRTHAAVGVRVDRQRDRPSAAANGRGHRAAHPRAPRTKSGMPTSRCGCRLPSCWASEPRTCSVASIRSSPRGTGRRRDRRRFVTNCAKKEFGWPASCAR